MTPEAFYAAYAPDALYTEQHFGVPRLFTLAQSALETGWGKHAPGNMMFGVKATKGWTGLRQLLRTTEYLRTAQAQFPVILSITGPDANGFFKYDVKDWFRAYHRPRDSFIDHATLLRSVKNYAPAFAHANDAREFAKAIARGGYATAPTYAASLIALIAMLERIEATQPAPTPAAPKPSLLSRILGWFR